MKPMNSRTQMQEILAGLAEADRGEFASAEEVKAVFDRHIGADGPS
jgi:predicted transcriptional regulator